MILLLGLLCAIWVDPAWSHKEDGSFSFEGNIQQDAVANNSVYIATEEKLYQLSHDLTLLHSLTQRGILKDHNGMGDAEFHRISGTDLLNARFSVNILIPFARNDTVVSCGVTNNYCGYCEILDLKNISKLVYSESIQVGPQRSSSGSVSFLVDVKEDSGQTETYILTAIKNPRDKTECSDDLKTINLQNTNHKQHGDIFSWSCRSGGKPGIQTEADVEFVDGFQINSTVYLFSNVASGGPKNLKPKVVLLNHNDMTSVLVMKKKAWMVFFIGTADGLLMKLAVDRKFKPTCPEILYRDSEKRKVFPKIHLDQVDQNHVYLQLKNKIERVPVSRCSTHRNVRACLSAQDPLCLWCVSEDSCTFEDHCTDSEWMSVPDEAQQEMISHRVVKDSSGMIKVLIQTHLAVQQKVQSNFTCEFSSNSSQICRQQGLSAQFPRCTCILIDSLLTDVLDVTIKISIGKSELTEQRKLINCSSIHGQPSPHLCRHCISSGCQWIENSCSWASELTHNTQKDVCLEIEAGMNISIPDVISVTPSVVSLYGKNHALLSGHNLNDVIGMIFFLLGLFCSIWGEPVRGFNFKEDLRQLAVGNNSVYIATEENFYQLSHDLTLIYNLTHRGILKSTDQLDKEESPVWNNTGVSLTFHIPTTETRRVVKMCVLLPDGSCHGNTKISYQSSPVCTDIVPRSSWRSGKRKVKLIGTHLEFVDGLMQSHAQHQVLLPRNRSSQETLTYDTPTAENSQICCSTVFMKVANQTVACLVKLTYYPDPEFTGFTTERLGNDARVVIHKSSDKLEMTAAELLVWGVEGENQYPCIKVLENHNKTDSFICDIQGVNNTNFRAIKSHVSLKHTPSNKVLPTTDYGLLQVKYGYESITLNKSSSLFYVILLVIFLIPITLASSNNTAGDFSLRVGSFISVVFFVYRRQRQQFTVRMNKLMENLECDIRNDIRQGFIDLQTEKADLMENVGAIPFLDYKHFASRTFFPESDSLIKLCVKDIGQDVEKVELDQHCQRFSSLIQDQLFLTTMVHALEEQKSFTIKDKCTLASLLTVALHGNLSYLTEVMEVLLKDLMQQNSATTQPKLLLRRTESTVEKLLTNWVSVCLYGFLRESVGQHLFLLVSALTQQISKGPVDCVTEKALYTLSEDWLLWQAQDFSQLKLKVLFAVGSDGEVSEPLEVDALSCDTVEQLKEKILNTFKTKFGFAYNTSVRDVSVEYERDGSFLPLQEVDRGSEVIGEVTKLNTLRHYKVNDGATVKVLSRKTHPPLSPQGSVKDDENFSGKYFHLIDPDVVEDHGKNPERKKLKLKEVHLTKLLSTKARGNFPRAKQRAAPAEPIPAKTTANVWIVSVAVHSYVENLFRSIWGMTQSKAPLAIKYFFDFLDTQAETMKITDPDVRHIWKTNSLPLRFWINILKNPQFVFDMEKTPHLDGCLSVIAQAFMDSFSLSETQLGKHAPTNKLLYAKDIPKFKQEVKAYYKQIREQPAVSDAEFKDFLKGESKKHEGEFNEAAALRELFKFIQRYFTEIKEKLSSNGAPAELLEQLQHVKDLFDGLKSCSWN
ncbi:hypothetical protein CCH79_00016058 [Gambusia affinis]|uniref:Uncharacterized protein n=1 Tax=Gambusia affinis TaxID=33528 RepID=A0A315V9F3_GAMAF|nr:hypothetical protein CCH79_00016058 [Gambusia affinis]